MFTIIPQHMETRVKWTLPSEGFMSNLFTSLVAPVHSLRRWAAPSVPRSPWQPHPPAGSVTSPSLQLPASPGPDAASERAHTGAPCQSWPTLCWPWPAGAAWCCRPPAGCWPVAAALRPRLPPFPNLNRGSVLVVSTRQTRADATTTVLFDTVIIFSDHWSVSWTMFQVLCNTTPQ